MPAPAPALIRRLCPAGLRPGNQPTPTHAARSLTLTRPLKHARTPTLPYPPPLSSDPIRPRDPVAIVRVAIADHRRFKDAARALADCEPSAPAAEVLIEAHDAGKAPAWLVACLLGHVRHRAGMPRVLEILRGGHRSLSEDYAASAARQIAGDDARADLEAVIDTVDDGTVRKAAAWALGALTPPASITFLSAAIARRRLHARTVAEILVPVSVEPDTLIAAMRSDDGETRRWPAMLLARRLRSPEAHGAELARCAQSAPLREQLARLLAEGEPTIWDEDARWIERWLGALR